MAGTDDRSWFEHRWTDYRMRMLRGYLKLFRSRYSVKNAVKVMDREWDHLILLDACRYDMYRDLIGSDVGSIVSGGSMTKEFIKFNFQSYHDDVVCIAGNPHLATPYLRKLFDRVPFYHVVELWDHGWDPDLKTVPPGAVTDAALEAAVKFPDKRLYIHYNQPHHPFIGDEELLKIDDGTWHTLEGVTEGEKTMIWDRAEDGEVSKERVWKAYKENLRLAMIEVDRLLEDLEGRIVITSDHGNQVGEYGLWGHKGNLRTEQSVKVPWHVIKDTPRKAGPASDEIADHSEKQRIDEAIKALKVDGKI